MTASSVLQVVALLAIIPSASGRSIDACDAGELAQTLAGRKLNTKELLRVCQQRFSQGVCSAAGHTLSSSLSEKLRNGPVSLPEFAELSCSAMEATLLQQQALLLRQNRELAANFADRSSDKTSRLDSGLAHKDLPIPHGTFVWEYSTAQSTKSNRSNSSSNASSLASKVAKMELAERGKVNETSPEVAQRARAFTSFVTTSTAPPKTKGAASGKNASALQDGMDVMSSLSQSEKELVAQALDHMRPGDGKASEKSEHERIAQEFPSTLRKASASEVKLLSNRPLAENQEFRKLSLIRKHREDPQERATPTLAQETQLKVAAWTSPIMTSNAGRSSKAPRSTRLVKSAAKASATIDVDSLVAEVAGQSTAQEQ